jgi:hypothetical protein
MIPFGIRHDPTVVEKQIDVVLRREERARVPLQHEVGRTVRLIVSTSSASAAWITPRSRRQIARCQSGSASM